MIGVVRGLKTGSRELEQAGLKEGDKIVKELISLEMCGSL